MRHSLFISYRRADSQGPTGRLADNLREYFGEGRVYRDLDSNRSAADYVVQMQEALAASRVVLAVIGSRWLSSTDGQGRQRLRDPGDLVRIELERALASGIAVVPVLVDGATMPAERDVPASLQSLTRLHAQRLNDDDWRFDFGRLLETLERHGVLPTPRAAAEPELATKVRQSVTTVRRYQRTMRASRRRAYDAVLGATELLHYPRVAEDPQAAKVEACWTGAGSVKTRPASRGWSGGASAGARCSRGRPPN